MLFTPLDQPTAAMFVTYVLLKWIVYATDFREKPGIFTAEL